MVRGGSTHTHTRRPFFFNATCCCLLLLFTPPPRVDAEPYGITASNILVDVRQRTYKSLDSMEQLGDLTAAELGRIKFNSGNPSYTPWININGIYAAGTYVDFPMFRALFDHIKGPGPPCPGKILVLGGRHGDMTSEVEEQDERLVARLVISDDDEATFKQDQRLVAAAEVEDAGRREETPEILVGDSVEVLPVVGVGDFFQGKRGTVIPPLDGDDGDHLRVRFEGGKREKLIRRDMLRRLETARFQTKNIGDVRASDIQDIMQNFIASHEGSCVVLDWCFSFFYHVTTKVSDGDKVRDGFDDHLRITSLATFYDTFTTETARPMGLKLMKMLGDTKRLEESEAPMELQHMIDTLQKDLRSVFA